MPIINIIFVLIVVGVALWIVNMIPMDSTIRSIIHGLVVICVVVWLVSLFFPLGTIGTWRVHKLR
jgi:hypothetical protein